MTCPRCGAAMPVGHRFCENCGLDAATERAGTTDVHPPDEPCKECGAAPGGAEYCPECGLLVPDGTDHVERKVGAAAGVSDRGHVHSRNEDAMALGLRRDTGTVAAVVCDGVSSTRRPQDASRAAVDAALTVLLEPIPEDVAREDIRTGRTVVMRGSIPTDERAAHTTAEAHAINAVAAAADATAALAASGDLAAPSCTLVGALVEPSGTITVTWVGDSRAYWLAAEGSRLLTADHSWAAEQIAAGLLDEETAMADPRAHGITRWLGADGEPYPEVRTLVEPGAGMLLLCSDGLWNYLPDATELARVALAAGSPAAAAAELTTIALDAGGRDNITVVLIAVRERSFS